MQQLKIEFEKVVGRKKTNPSQAERAVETNTGVSQAALWVPHLPSGHASSL